MRGSLFLAWRHIIHHRVRSAILVACLTLTFLLPIGSRILMSSFKSRLIERASSTPLVIGATGSRFDLTMNALYFRGKPPRETTMREVTTVRESGYARAIPLLVKFQAGGFPIVGTTSDYFTFRRLRAVSGVLPHRLGDCVLGSTVARQLGLKPGDPLLSEPELSFDFDDSFTLRMRVTGVLATTGTSDDHGVFVDLATSWLIAGIGHGHVQSPTARESETGLNTTNAPRHDASLTQFTEITDDNVGSFHFHGRESDFPLTVILAIPHDERSTTLLEGRYLRPDATTQALRPREVVTELLEFVVQLQQFFDALFAVLAVVTTLFLALVVALSVRLRAREFLTMTHLGCRPALLLQLIVFEQFMLISAGATLATVVAMLLRLWSVDLGVVWQTL